jgi:cytochrome P450
MHATSMFGVRNLVDFVRSPLTFLEDAVEKNGDFVPFKVGGARWLFLNHPDYIEQMFVLHAASMGRDDYSRILRRALGQGLLTSDGELWKRQRKLASTAFTPKRIKGYAKAMADVTEQGLMRWQGEKVVNLHEELSHLTMEVVADVLFGASVDARDVVTVRETMEVFNDFFAQSPEAILRVPPWVATPRNRAMNHACASIDQLVYRIIEARRREMAAGREMRNDLLGALLAATDESGKGMDDLQLRDETITLFLAGHETTALALTHTLYLLARHPEVERRLLNELETVLGVGVGARLPTEEDVPRLVLCERVIKEAMRLYPPAWLTGREAMADVTIGGREVPKGTQIIVSQWTVHRDPRWFRDPEAFDPDRFDPELVKARPRFSYFPFGGGPRFCIGNHFAMMEAVLMLAVIARRYHIELLPHTELRFSPSVTLRPAGAGLRARIVPRAEEASRRAEVVARA